MKNTNRGGEWVTETPTRAGASQWVLDRYLYTYKFDKLDFDLGDGIRGVGVLVSLSFGPSQDDKKNYSKFNVIVKADGVVRSGPGNYFFKPSPVWFDEDSSNTSFDGDFTTPVNKNYSAVFTGQINFVGWQGNQWVTLATANLGYFFNNGKLESYISTTTNP